ncbi:MAG: hypothetical protein GKR96_04230 [Gammaproteobacteria bacterium]|nr:hypothetical protein [Gammaproteobacteria bacterium]
MKTKIRSKGGSGKLMGGLRETKRKKVSVGVVDSQKHIDGKKVTDMAALYHHLGQGPVGKKGKSWPTLESGVKDAKTESRVKVALREAAVGHGAAGLHKIGGVISLKVKSNIQGIKSPALEQSTIDKKGSSNPLVDTEQLKKAINYKIQ